MNINTNTIHNRNRNTAAMWPSQLSEDTNIYSALLNRFYMASVHNLTVGHCNIQGGLIGISKSTQILDMIKSIRWIFYL